MKPTHLIRSISLGIAILWLGISAISAGAQVNIQVGIQLPPPLVFSEPPQVVILPQTYVYAVPDIEEDVFFVDGWWWRPWQGRWYRSQYYDRGWGYYSSVPSFYREVPQEWRHEYREHQWRGQPWNYERMSHERVEHNWSAWKRDHYWEHHQTWGVQGLNSQPHEHDRPRQVPQSEAHAQQPWAMQSNRHGQQTQAPQAGHHGQHAPAARSEHHDQQAQARNQQPQQPNKRHGSEGPGNQEQHNEHQGHGKTAQHQEGKSDK